jgi:type IV pilus assembly protein PilE
VSRDVRATQGAGASRAAAERVRGFTLTEVMITLVIVSILASIALPSYRNYVVRANRGDATQALLRIAAQQEKYYIQNNSYASSLDAGGLDMDTKSEHGWYDLSITAGDVNGFTAQAVPASDEAQADDDDCQRFSIDSEGRKLAENAARESNEDVCWR